MVYNGSSNRVYWCLEQEPVSSLIMFIGDVYLCIVLTYCIKMLWQEKVIPMKHDKFLFYSTDFIVWLEGELLSAALGANTLYCDFQL